MKISGQYTLSADRQQVYEALLDPKVLERTLPGCQSLEPEGSDSYLMKMKLSVASVQGLFEGRVALEEQQPPESYRLRVEGQGKIGFVKGNGQFKLRSSSPSTTIVEYVGDVRVGGLIAGVGQRLIDITAKMMIKRFFTSLTHVLEETDRN